MLTDTSVYQTQIEIDSKNVVVDGKWRQSAPRKQLKRHSRRIANDYMDSLEPILKKSQNRLENMMIDASQNRPVENWLLNNILYEYGHTMCQTTFVLLLIVMDESRHLVGFVDHWCIQSII